MENRTLAFPANFSIGKISIRDREGNGEWSLFAQATGNVFIPADKEARLDVAARAAFDPEIFSSFDENALADFEWVSTSKVTDAAIQHIQHLTGLKGLALWETPIGDLALRHVRHLSHLRWLDIGDTKITDNGLVYLIEMRDLASLTLLNDKITDRGLVELQKLPGLVCLDLMRTLITDQGIESLCTMNRLRFLRICDTSITEEGFNELKVCLADCGIRYHHPHHA